MSANNRRTLMFSAAVIATALGGLVCGAVLAADADRLAVAKDSYGGGLYAGQGESPETLKTQAGYGVKDYEDPAKEGGGGAAQKTLIDNDAVKVILVDFKKGFVRPGGVKRRYNTLLVYVDPGRYTITKGAGQPTANPRPAKLAPGSAVFHRKESIVSESHIDEDYRVLFVEMKN